MTPIHSGRFHLIRNVHNRYYYCMNVLLFVTSLLMILSLLTYAKLDGFRYFLGMDAQFERYMSSVERSYTSEKAIDWYKTTMASTKSKPRIPPKGKVQANLYLV